MLFSGLTQIKALKTESAGSSFKYSAIHEEDHVIAKLSFYPLDSYYDTYNYQIVEAQIYEHVLHNLLQYTPHIPKWYMTINGEFDFKNSNLSVSGWDCPKKWNLNHAQSLVIEHVGSTDLYSVWSQLEDNPKIIFQVLYTIACFERVGLRHNDLHTGNIMISKLRKPITLSYEIQGKIISFQTTNLVKIIDYDRSCIYSDKVERNGYIDDESLNQSNGINNGFDVFKFLHNYKNTNGKVKTWLSIVCPQIEFISGFNGLLQRCMNPRNFVGDTLDLITSLAQHFPDVFKLYDTFDKPFYKLPPDTSIKPIIDKTTFLTHKQVKPFKNHTFDSLICQELLTLGYNWKLHCMKLYSELVYDDVCDEEDEEIYNYCMWVTNPIKISKPNKDLSSLIKFQPIISIPQKPFKKDQEEQEQKDEDQDEEQDEDQDEEQDEDQERDLDEEDYTYLQKLPEQYKKTKKWHKKYTYQEIEDNRMYLCEIAKKYVPKTHIEHFYRIYKPFDKTKKYVISMILETISLIMYKGECRKLRAIFLYIMMAMLSRTLSYLKKEVRFLYTLEEKVLEFKAQNIDYSCLLAFDIPVVPKIEEVLQEIL
jgi:hypothetical protein